VHARHLTIWMRATGLLCLLVLSMLGSSCAESTDTGDVELELWTLALRPTFTEYVEGMLAEFETANPGVTVRWVDVPFEALSRKLIAAAAAGRAPDVVNFSDLQFARFDSLGATRDLTDLLDASSESVYLEGAMAPARINGKLGALPWYLTTPICFINTEILDEAGWDPQTLGYDWQTLQTQARAYHAETGRFLFTQALAVESDLPKMLISEGLPPFKEVEGRLQADLTGDEVVEYVEGWVDLYRDGVLPREAATAGHAHVVELYQNGQVALAVTGANFLSRIADAAPQVFRATEVRRTVTGKLNRAHIAVMFVSVTSTSKHPEEATALAAWVTSPAYQLALCKQVNIMPSTPGVLSDPHFNPRISDSGTAEAKIDTARALSAESLRTAVAFVPSIGAWPDLRRAFDEGIKSALLDGRDVRETLAAIEREWDRILDAEIPATLDTVPRPEPAPQTTPNHGGEVVP
jgi:putative chitobiose transport system substrate-binding protein